jgi:propanediol dehydratase medium subunit
MARPAYQAIEAVNNIKETKYVIPHSKPVEMQIDFE